MRFGGLLREGLGTRLDRRAKAVTDLQGTQAGPPHNAAVRNTRGVLCHPACRDGIKQRPVPLAQLPGVDGGCSPIFFREHWMSTRYSATGPSSITAICMSIARFRKTFFCFRWNSALLPRRVICNSARWARTTLCSNTERGRLPTPLLAYTGHAAHAAAQQVHRG